MKKLKYIFPLFAFLLFACDSDDDGFYNTVYVQAENLVHVELENVYLAGDPIFVNAHIPKLLIEPGFPDLLDIRKTTGNAPSFRFSYFLEKKNASGVWEVVDIGSNYADGGEGDADIYYGVNAILTYDESDEEYRYRGGVIPTQPGQYRLNFGNSTENYNKAILVSNSRNNSIILNIFSTSTEFNASGTHEFLVN